MPHGGIVAAMSSTALTRSPSARAALAAIALISLLLTACASDDPTVAEPTDATAEGAASDEAADGANAAFTDTDVAFLQGMVPHHAQAVEMAALVADRTAHPDELGPLAEEITATQQEEIDTMNGLLEQAGEDPVDASMGDMDMGDHSDMDMGGMQMSGMMSAEDLTALADADGDTFDGLFLEMMIAHHEGAIEAAQQVLDQEDGNSEVAALAEAIIAAQEAEIEQMTAWQEEWAV